MPSSGRFGVFLRGISPPAGGEFLCPRRQRNQNAAGGRLRMDTSCPYSPYPRSPITGVTPLGGQNPTGARKQECLGAVPSGPTGGLSGRKIGVGAVPLLRLGFRTNAPGTYAVGPVWDRPLRNGMAASSPAVGAAHRAARKPSPYKGADSPYQGEMSRSDRGDRDRCPRRGRMRVPSWLTRPPAGGPRASPTQSRKMFLKLVEEGTTPLIKGRYRAQRDKGDRDLPLPRAGQCPAPTKKKELLPGSP